MYLDEILLLNFSISAVGCEDPVLPVGATLSRDFHKAEVTCNESTKSWHLICQDSKWVGQVENCTRGEINLPHPCVRPCNISMPYSISSFHALLRNIYISHVLRPHNFPLDTCTITRLALISDHNILRLSTLPFTHAMG